MNKKNGLSWGISVFLLVSLILINSNVTAKPLNGLAQKQMKDEGTGNAVYLPLLINGEEIPGTNHAPYMPSSPSPVNGASNQMLNLTLTWTGGDPDGDALTYDVYMEANDNTPDLLVSNVQTNTGFETGLLAANTIYYWQIIVTDSEGASKTGPIWNFTTLNHAPNTPAFPNPANGADGQAQNLTLSWLGGDPDGDVVTYDIYLEAGDTTPDILVSENQSGTSFVTEQLTGNATYYWKIIATDSGNAAATGPVWSFTTLNHIPSMPSSPNPANTAIDQVLNPTLTWTGGDPDGDVVTYDIYFEAGDTTPDFLVSENQSGTSFVTEQLTGNTTYYWKIIATDSGNAAATGPVWSFTTLNHVPNTPSSPSPAIGAIEQVLNQTLAWTGGDPDGDMITYDVYLEAGDTTPDILVSNDQSNTFYYRSGLTVNTTYYWQIIATDSAGLSTPGPVWYFTTSINHSPNMPNSPSPESGAINQNHNITLSWMGGDLDGDAVTYDVYLEANDESPDILFSNDQNSNSLSRSLGVNIIYYWQIIATDSFGATTTGPVWSFTTSHNQAPNTPSFPSPDNEAVDQADILTLSWIGGDPDGDTVRYAILFASVNPPNVFVSSNQNDTSYVTRTLASDTTYFWQVVSTDSYGDSATGPVWSFSTTNHAPNVPASPNPADAAISQNLNLTLSWMGGDPDGSEVTYDVYLKASDTTPDDLVSGNQSSNSYNIGPLTANTTYYWQIVAKDHSLSTEGPVWQFRTLNQVPNIPASPFPLNYRSIESTNPITLSWTGGDPDGDAVTYDVYLEAGNSDPDILVSNDQSSTSFLTGTLNSNTIYYWKIIAMDSRGAITTSPIWQFTIMDPLQPIDDVMVEIPAGDFQMGCATADCSTNSFRIDELPLHTVTMSSYSIDKYPVTNYWYAQCVDAGTCQAPHFSSSRTRDLYYDDPQYKNYPVINISWNDANDFCAWAGKRLPSEAEWQKAARGSSDTRQYPWGNDTPTCTLTNFYDGTDYCVGDTTSVDNYPLGVSPYGVWDMSGNVKEWVNDWYDANYYSISPASNPPGAQSGEYKVILSDGWNANAPWISLTNRHRYSATDWNSNRGFRCAKNTATTNRAPFVPNSPSPMNNSRNQPLDTALSWLSGDLDGDTVTFDVYLEAGDSTPDILVSADQSTMNFTPVNLMADSQYFWQIVATDSRGEISPSPVWNFATPGFVSLENMILIPNGTFTMGCDPDHNGGYECPPYDQFRMHIINLDSYYMDTYEVTNEKYRQCVEFGFCTEPSLDNYYYQDPTKANFPVYRVNWQNAKNYCAWQGKRLPTEAEWEKAARGSTDGRVYPWGDQLPDCTLANKSGCSDGPVEIGSYPSGASPYGVMDMAGNVMEWVNDWYSPYIGSPVNNPQGPEEQPESVISKVVRGGSWDDYSSNYRTFDRSYHFSPIYTHYDDLGFRCAADFETTNHSPQEPNTPFPSDTSINNSINPILTWISGDVDGDSVTYNVYLEANDTTPDVLVSENNPTMSYSPGLLSADHYYWYVLATDENGATTASEVWEFRTEGNVSIQNMIRISAGNFQMGCDPDHNGGYPCEADELPLQTVNVVSYYIDKYEVTNADYAQCVAAGKCNSPEDWFNHPSPYFNNPLYDNYPVVYVSWGFASSYCNWVGKRLPTEAEWEKAARGPDDTRAFSWGDQVPDCTYTNFGGVSGCVGEPVSVGSYPLDISPYGVMDMAGNVAEFTKGWDGVDLYYARGGDWSSLINNLRLVNRSYFYYNSRRDFLGFRCAALAGD